MSERVTMSMTTRLLLADIQDAASRLTKTQQRISSGKQLTVPSDDPFGASRALLHRSELDSYRQYQRNVREAASWQEVTDAALGSIGEFTLRARDLLIQGASDTTSPAGRDAIADEIDQIIDAIKNEGNVQYAGRYVFSGTRTTTAPYSTASDVYAGDTNAVVREIGRGVQVNVSVPGLNVIGNGATGLIASLRQISADLRSGSTAALQGADIQALDAAHDALINARSTSGALGTRLEVAQARLGELEESALRFVSETEDADMAKTLVDYSTQQAAYQAALKAGAHLIQPSLLDFLG